MYRETFRSHSPWFLQCREHGHRQEQAAVVQRDTYGEQEGFERQLVTHSASVTPGNEYLGFGFGECISYIRAITFKITI